MKTATSGLEPVHDFVGRANHAVLAWKAGMAPRTLACRLCCQAHAALKQAGKDHSALTWEVMILAIFKLDVDFVVRDGFYIAT